MWEHQKEKVPKEEGRTRRLKLSYSNIRQNPSCLLSASHRNKVPENVSEFRNICSRKIEKHAGGACPSKKKDDDEDQPKKNQLLFILHSCNQSRTRFLSTILSFDVFILASPAKVLSMIFPTRPRNSSSRGFVAFPCKIRNAYLGQLPMRP